MNGKNTANYGVLGLIIFISLIGALTASLMKLSLAEVPPVTFTFLRMVFAFITILPFFIFEKAKIGLKDFASLVAISILPTANIMLYVFGLKMTTANISQVLYAGVPIVAAVFAYFYLKEKTNALQISGLVLGFIGMLIITIFLSGNNVKFPPSLLSTK